MTKPRSIGLAAPLRLVAAAEGSNALPRISLLAYTGGVIRPAGWWEGVIVDLAGVEIPSQSLPIRFAHRSGWADGVGHTESVSVASGELNAEGVISRDTPTAREVVTAARNGFPWQASIGAEVLEVEFLREGVTTTVNGQQVSGPVEIARKTRLYEISVVDLGADANTEVSIAAQGDRPMPNEVNANQTPAPKQSPAPVADPAVAPVAVPPAPQDVLARWREEHAAEVTRLAEIHRLCAGQPQIEARAIREGWDAAQTELEMLRASRPVPAVISGASSVIPTTQVLEAALAQATRLPNAERHFTPEIMQAAHTRYRGRLSLQELLLEAAWSTGYSGRSFRSDPRGVLRAAFSSADIGGILSNNANKFLIAGWNTTEQSWRAISRIRPVSDFKTNTVYRLTGNLKYEQVAPTGELKHGDLSEMEYTNKADTYGKMLSISRQDLINDDLGAVSDIPRMLGRGGGLKLNDVFWTEYMDNSAFFASGNNNYITGATAGDTTESRLSVDGLTRAVRTFRDQTDSEGEPLGVEPRLLLVPNRLEYPAKQLYTSSEIRDTTATTKAPVGNVHAGLFQPVVSSYLGNSSYTGYSTVAWYLLASPDDLPVIEVVALNGQEMPIIESADADFNVLGIQMRGYHDFGVALQEYRGGVKAKGEA